MQAFPPANSYDSRLFTQVLETLASEERAGGGSSGSQLEGTAQRDSQSEVNAVGDSQSEG